MKLNKLQSIKVARAYIKLDQADRLIQKALNKPVKEIIKAKVAVINLIG
jgi:hypothetical protein